MRNDARADDRDQINFIANNKKWAAAPEVPLGKAAT